MLLWSQLNIKFQKLLILSHASVAALCASGGVESLVGMQRVM